MKNTMRLKERIRVIDNIGETLNFMKVALNGDEHRLSPYSLPVIHVLRHWKKVTGRFRKDICEILPDMSVCNWHCTYQRTMGRCIVDEPPRGA